MRLHKLTMNKIMLSNIKSHKKQYVLLLISFIVIAMLSSTIILSGFSYKESLRAYMDKRVGSQDVILDNAQLFNLENKEYKKIIKEYGYAHITGLGYTEKAGEENGALMAWFDSKSLDMSKSSIVEGRLPSQKGEIAIEKNVLYKLDSSKKLGDKIELNVKIPDSKDYLPEDEVREYKIVGILFGQSDYIGQNITNEGLKFDYPGIIVSSKEQNTIGNERTMAFINFRPYEFKFRSSVSRESILHELINKDLVKQGILQNKFDSPDSVYSNFRDSDEYFGIFNYDEEFYILTIICIISLVLLIISCGVVKAFADGALLSRYQQIEIFRALGATKKQIVKLFGREVIALAIFALPLGLAASVLLLPIILKHFNNNLIFKVDSTIVLLSFALSLVSIFISLIIPIIKMYRCKPINRPNNIKIKLLKSKNNFNATTLIAKRSLMLTKNKSAILIMTVAAIIFVSNIGFTYLDLYKRQNILPLQVGKYSIESIGKDDVRSGYLESLNYNTKSDYTYTNISNDVVEQLTQSGYFQSVDGIKKCNANLVYEASTPNYVLSFDRNYNGPALKESDFKDFDSLYKYIKKNRDQEYNLFKNKIYSQREFFATQINGFDNDRLTALNKYLIDGSINIERIDSGEEIILYAYPQTILGLELEDSFGQDNNVSNYSNYNSLISNIKIKGKQSLKADLCYKAGDYVTISVLNRESGSKRTDNSNLNLKLDDIKNNEKRVKIGAIVSVPPENAVNCKPVSFLTSNKGLDKFYSNCPYIEIDAVANKAVDDETDAELTSYLNQFNNDKKSKILSDYTACKQNTKLFKAFFASSIFIIFLLCSISIVLFKNFVSEHINYNKQEIGILRSLGATFKEIIKIFLTQIFIIVGIGLGLGLFISVLFIFIANVILDNNGSTVLLNYILYPCALLSIILIIFSAISIFRKVKVHFNNSIVQNIMYL